jgi:HD-GYP domain-containing protein (c-di-GMP phosphodiesterase class II)
MDSAKSTWLRRAIFGVVALSLLGVLAYLLVYALRGWDFAELHLNKPSPDDVQGAHNLLPPVIAAMALAICALVLWWLEARRNPEEVAQVGEELAEELERQREHSRALERSRQMLAQWNRKLRHELSELHRQGGVLGSGAGVEELVLRMSMELTDASKGLLFERSSGGDGLDVVSHAGFEDPDPHDSWLVRRFANEVIERDEIVREDLSGRDAEANGNGSDDIQNLIAVPVYISDEFSGVVVCANSDSYGTHDDDVLIALGDHAGAVLENTRLQTDLRDAYISTVDMLAEAIRAKDPHLGGHSREVSEYVHRVAQGLGLDPQRREQLIFASLLHDIGKIGISERILLKPASLTDEEFTVIKLHPRIGSRLVEQVSALAPLAPAILLHHERWDGTGYPSGLKGEEIPLEARVIGVADAFSAMTSDRPYRGRMSLDEACTELERCAGTQFDPEVVRRFVEEVRADPPDGGFDPVAEALDDPEIRSRRDGGDLLLGRGPLELIDPLTLL